MIGLALYDRPADRGHTQAAPNSNEAKIARHEDMICQLTLWAAVGTSLALHWGSTHRLPQKTLRRATLIEDIQISDEAEALHVLRVDLGGELGAVRLHAPVSRLTRWPAGDLWPAGRALATRLSAEPDLVRGRRVLELGTGLGIAGIAAADAGARHVFLSGVLCGNQITGRLRWRGAPEI